MKKVVSFIFVAVSVLFAANFSVLANTAMQLRTLQNYDNIPIIYAGKLNDSYENMNTCEVEISDIEDDVNIEFPEGIKVISYEITDVEGIKNLKKGVVLVDKIDNKIALSVVKDDNKEMQSLSIRFNITASPEYRGDVYVNLEDNDVKTIVAKVNSPININAESTEGRTDHRKNSVADIVISENFIGAMTKNSELILETEGMLFDDTFELQIEGDIDVNLNVADGKIMIKTIKESLSSPSKIIISNVSLISGQSYEEGNYPLLSVAGTQAAVDADNVIKRAGSSPMFETYYENNTELLQLFSEDKVVINEGYFIVKNKYGIPNDMKMPNEIIIKIGSDIIEVDGQVMKIDAPAYISGKGCTMLPLRSIVGAISNNEGILEWNGAEKKVQMNLGYRCIELQIGDDIIYANGKPYYMSGQLEIVNGRVFVPIRDLSNVIGIRNENIIWDSKSMSVRIVG
ncbi:MAG: copper amine oxidase N-terminal domain-containing protein [Tissierellia bacterium]|nr:copper amine oxidase N-terminal domain-containing protein [Tissierellia bacterium]